MMTINNINIYTATQIKLIDNHTIKDRSISSIGLMEIAATNFVKRLLQLFDELNLVFIFCGPGNNGGDGLAIARLLITQNIAVKVFFIKDVDESSNDLKLNFDRLKKLEIKAVQLNNENLNFSIPPNALIVDAIFGAGLNKPVTGTYEKLISKINKSPNKVISVDIPSGLHQDHFLESEKIKADITITFQYAKLAFLLAENEKYVGEWFAEDIGLFDSCIPQNEVKYKITNPSYLKTLLKKRSTFSHKGNFGHCLVVAGSLGKIGAALLCVKSVLKAGAGLVTAHIPKCGYQIMQNSIWEAMVDTDVLDYIISETKTITNYNSIAIGPGLGKDIATLQALKDYLKTEKPMVIDADALNLVAENEHLKKYLKNKILTPHPKEFERLFGQSKNSYERLSKLQEAANDHQCTVVLKGAYTAIADYKTNQIHFNSTGNSGLATAGSGDVLTGIIAGLLAQGYNNFEAAILGVYLHGLSADIYTETNSPESLIAGDIIDNIGKAYVYLEKK